MKHLVWLGVLASTALAIASGTMGAAATSPVAPQRDIRDVFKLAFGRPAPATVRLPFDKDPRDTRDYVFKPITTVAMPSGLALVSVGDDGSAPQWRRVAIHYFGVQAGQLKLARAWTKVAMGTENISVSHKLSRFPVLYSETTPVGAGGTETTFTLTEMRDRGPVALGTFMRESGPYNGPPTMTTKILNPRQGGFQLLCTERGKSKVITFVRNGDRFVADDPRSCRFE